MPIYKRNRYTPPSFRLFQANGFGFLVLAEAGVGLAEGDLRQTVKDLDGGWGPPSNAQAVALYSHWTRADDFLRRLMSMPEEEREKHLKLDKRLKLDEIMDRHAKVGAMIKRLETERPKELGELLDRQLKYELEEWLGYLIAAKGRVLDYEDVTSDPMENVEDYASQRDHLEYAKVGLRENRLDGRLQQLRFYDEFAERLEASDKLFEAVLDGKRGRYF